MFCGEVRHHCHQLLKASGDGLARQNIDEDWKTDPRRTALVEKLGDSRLADGLRVQVNWLVLDHKGGPIPLKKFRFLRDHSTWIECGLAAIDGEAVVVAGADRYLEYFEKQRVNGSKGGRPKKPRETQNNPTVTKANPKNPSSSSSSSLRKKKGEAIFFENLPDLLAAIPKDTKENWAKLYAKEFIDRHLIRAWNHYSADHKARPLAAWSRALGGWLERQTKFDERDAKAQRKDMPESGDLGGEYALR